MLPRLFAVVDLVKAGLIDEDFIFATYMSAIEMAKPAVLLGGTSTSLEPAGSSVDYRLLDGVDIETSIPALSRLYSGPLIELASRISGESLQPSPDRVSGVNLNVLDGGGGRYEWHVDSNPITGLLVLSECDKERGGRLLFESDPRIQTAFCMKPGHFLLFDATRTPHSVETVRSDEPRVTAPMNFFVSGEPIIRPTDLDSTLYGR